MKFIRFRFLKNEYYGLLHNPSTTILIPCRNEQGNIENAVKRIPAFCKDIV